jgi:hypothetical protein
MTHILFSGRRRPWLPVVAFAATATLGAVSAASGSNWGGWRQRDQVTISGSPTSSVTLGQAYSFTPSATDTSGRRLVFAIANQPAWATFSTGTGQLSGTPSMSGTYSNIVIAASDGIKTATLPAFTVQVLASQSSQPAPTISGTPATADVAGSPYSFQPSASGPSGMPLSFSVQNKPAWANFSIASGQLSGTPASTQTGTYSNIVISVSDGQASGSLAPFAVAVTNPPATTGSATVSLTPPTQDTDGSALTDLAGTNIYYGTSPSGLSQTVQVPGTAPSSYTVNNLASGTWYFAAVAYTTGGTQSAMSAVVSKAIP